MQAQGTAQEQQQSPQLSPSGSMSSMASSDPTVSKQATTINIPEPYGELDGALDRIATRTKLSFKNMTIKQLVAAQWQQMKSWGSFLDTNRMQMPPSTSTWAKRLVKNLEHFQANYMAVFLILVIYCILTSPLLLLAIAASLGACYLIALKNAESPLKIFGYKLSLGQQYIGMSILSFPLFYLAGAGSAVFWVLGASFFVIGLHASIYAIEKAPAPGEDEENLLPGGDPVPSNVAGPFSFSPIQTL